MNEPITIAPVPIGALDDAPTAPIDLILARPYQFKMVGNSMSPRYREGDTIYVDPTLLPEMDQDHVFLNRERRAIVGKLLLAPPSIWRIEQLRGHATEKMVRETVIELSVNEWPLCHPITECHRP
jgi:hypothetical protein